MKIQLSEVEGLGTPLYQVPGRKPVFQSLAVTEEERARELAEIGRMERGIRSACSWDDCRKQSISGSGYCRTHLIEALRPKGRG